MNKIDYEKSIVLLGPKAVGKSFVADKLSEVTGLDVISSDLLTNSIALKLSSIPSDELPRGIQKLVDNKELYPYVLNMAKIKQDEKLSPTTKRMGILFWKIRLLEEATNIIDYPAIFDFGADIGAVYELTSEEEKDINSHLFFYPSFIESRQSDFLKRFKNIYYLMPSKNYLNSKNDRIQSPDNVAYLTSPKSYTSFASKHISTDNLFYEHKFELTEKQIEALPRSERNSLINFAKLEEITNETSLDFMNQMSNEEAQPQ